MAIGGEPSLRDTAAAAEPHTEGSAASPDAAAHVPQPELPLAVPEEPAGAGIGGLEVATTSAAAAAAGDSAMVSSDVEAGGQPAGKPKKKYPTNKQVKKLVDKHKEKAKVKWQKRKESVGKYAPYAQAAGSWTGQRARNLGSGAAKMFFDFFGADLFFDDPEPENDLAPQGAAKGTGAKAQWKKEVNNKEDMEDPRFEHWRPNPDCKWIAPRSWVEKEVNLKPTWKVDGADDDDDEDQQELISNDFTYPILFTPAQCLTCIVLWLIYRYQDGYGGLDVIYPGQTDLALFEGACKDLRWEAWRWWTYQFTHVGLNHLGFNTMITALYGVVLERYHGPHRLFFMFNIGVFGGATVMWVFDPHVRVTGMSGGCYALMGILIGHVFLNYANIEKNRRRLQLLGTLAVAGVGLIPPMLDIGKAGVSHAAHFGGAAAGFLAGFVFGRNKAYDAAGREKPLQVLFFVTGIGLAVAAVYWLSYWAPRDIMTQVPWCWGRQISNFTFFGDDDLHCVRCDNMDCINRFTALDPGARYSPGIAYGCSGKWEISDVTTK
eukprot:TRINITY_DN19448_c0_g1_i1.p1 TRINITY_DN19448_c0_g1~~TRINITY_DN19448_c0_g1_i1.p1  ORF type:complete len:547 (+),score=141.37 TRINITY_DN19448_c0_g1_i1:167-1807(+)